VREDKYSIKGKIKMPFASLKLDETFKIQFDVEVFGTTLRPATVRFVFDSPIGIFILGNPGDGTQVDFEIPKLNGILLPGVYECHIEAFIEDKVFVPFRDTIEMLALEPLRPYEAESIEEDIRVSVKVKTSQEIEPKSQFEVEESDGVKYLKNSDGLYAGLLLESGELLVETPSVNKKEVIKEIMWGK
jgi:hypothetical protein